MSKLSQFVYIIHHATLHVKSNGKEVNSVYKDFSIGLVFKEVHGVILVLLNHTYPQIYTDP